MRKTTLLALLSATLSVTLGLGCASAEKKPDEPASAKAAPAKEAPAEKREATVTAVDKDDDAPPNAGPVYFQFDSTELLPEGRDMLQRMATWLQKHPDATLTIEGHADERGTEEYNLSLGQRRAEVMKTYLERLGVPSRQLKAISYGELKPAVEGSDEEAWALNRRGEVKLSGVGSAG